MKNNPYDALPSVPTFTLTSTDVRDATLSDDQRAVSPQLSWTGAPSGTKSFAITMYDADAPVPSGIWHWAVFGIPANVTSLPSNASATSMPEGAVQLPNDMRLASYLGAAPPKGHGPHRYYLVVHALDVETLPVRKDGTPAHLSFAMLGHTLGRATLVATCETK
ncbi:MAG: YbhB/YbcL family Raf kinase inhibitor-like protein [Archangium gephyra]|uniref:YbhB/YbcL family Raf kinase inhibitor-like protein n=1 Tax=Archangium gephyra TaxID=48 RepID=A0A2W5TFC1_9BACT|nr:MAG: YbhB/YbcL family Raf kinase inhibitor-like protein [Archangium gephyra]